MTLPSATPEDVQEQLASLLDEPPLPEGAITDDTPEADAIEQRVEVSLDEEDAPIG